MSMPSRPRAHELEDLSEIALGQLLGPNWTIHFQGKNDYGIDAEVEIFEHGKATGRFFKVQLKGSDSSRPKPTTRVSVSTFNYWLTSDLPVLVAHYQAATGRMFGIWAQSHELRFLNFEARTTTLTFPPESYLDPTTVRATLDEDLRRIQALKRGLRHPISYSLILEELAVEQKRRFSWAFRALADDTCGILTGGAGNDTSLSIVVTTSAVRIYAPKNLASVTTHFEDFTAADASAEDLAADSLAAVGIFLTKFGTIADAATLFIVAAENSVLLKSVFGAVYMSAALEADRRYVEAYRIARQLFLHPKQDIRNVSSFYMAVATLNLPVTEAPLGDDLVQLYEDRLSLELNQGFPSRAGTAAYNLGVIYNARGEVDKAIEYYGTAATYRPDYLHRGYFLRERGGMLWERSQYAEAAQDYRQALNNGADEAELVPLLADAYLYTGQYADAGVMLTGWTRQGTRLDRLAAVVMRISRLLTEHIGIEVQDRRDPTPDELAEIGDPPSPTVCNRFIREIDALNPQFWLVAAETYPKEWATEVSVLIAHMLEDQPTAWAIAIAFAADHGGLHDEFTLQLVDSGYYFCGESLIQGIEQVQMVLDVRSSEDLLDAVTNRITVAPDSRPASRTMRVVP
jgi:tetratricopeptide (TPR) repeat protein